MKKDLPVIGQRFLYKVLYIPNCSICEGVILEYSPSNKYVHIFGPNENEEMWVEWCEVDVIEWLPPRNQATTHHNQNPGG